MKCMNSTRTNIIIVAISGESGRESAQSMCTCPVKARHLTCAPSWLRGGTPAAGGRARQSMCACYGEEDRLHESPSECRPNVRCSAAQRAPQQRGHRDIPFSEPCSELVSLAGVWVGPRGLYAVLVHPEMELLTIVRRSRKTVRCVRPLLWE